MGKASKQTVGFKYYLAMHMGICRGPIDALLEIRVGDRTAWQGELTDNTTFSINKEDLFGGTKGEGGIKGTAYLMMGGASQTIPGALRNMIQGLCPQFRGVATLFYDGLVSAMNPYPKPWKFKVRRLRAGWDGPVWYPEKIQIDMHADYVDADGKAQGGDIKAMNGVHIIYEACTNRVWGRGMNRADMLDSAWRYAADLIYSEGLGLCIAWKRTDNLDSFVQKIIDHIGATIFVDKATGLMTIKIIRDDYNFADLPVLNPDNGLLGVSESSVVAGTGLINEIQVTYHSPLSNEDGRVQSHNLAGIQTAGSIVSSSTEYDAIPTAALAQRMADRDLNAQALPLRTFKLTADHRAWKVQPGTVFRIQDPKRGSVDIAIRAGAVEEMAITDGYLQISAVEDVFAMPVNGTAAVQPPVVLPPDRTPKVARRRAYEIPYSILNRYLAPADFNAIQSQNGYYGIAVERPSAAMMSYDLAMRAGGETSFDVRGSGDFVPLGELMASISYLDTTFQINKVVDGDEITTGTCIYLGEEIIRVDRAVLNADIWTLTIARGVYDTVPAPHTAGLLVWWFEDDVGTDNMAYLGGETVDGKALPWSLSGGRYPVDDAPIDTVKMNFRFFRPYAPGYVWLNGTVRWYQEVALNVNDPTLTISWNHRDRVTQSDTRVDHEVGDIGPEPGTAYKIVVYNEEGVIIRTETGINGKQYQYLWAQAMSDLGVTQESDGSEYNIVIRLWSRRDSFDSWQYYQMRVRVQDVPTYIQLAQLAVTTAQPAGDGTGGGETVPTEGLILAQMAQQTAQNADMNELPSDGVAVASLAASATQTSLMPIRMDAQVFEAPYLELYRSSLSLSNSRPMAVVARPSDRLTDGYDFWSSKVGENVEQNWQNSGSGAFTPWAVTTAKVDYLDTSLTYDSTSEVDGVDFSAISIGDLALIDSEIVRVDGIGNGTLLIARGVADTVPAIHWKNTPIWFFQKQNGMSGYVYDGTDKVGVKLRPHTFAAPYPMNLVSQIDLQLRQRPVRPYPPGQVIVDGHRWWVMTTAFQTDSKGVVTGRDINFTWRHRDRLSQAGEAVGHEVGNIGPEPGTKYRIWIGYTTVNAQGGANKVTLRTYDVEGTAFTYKAEWALEDGLKAGRAFDACGAVGVQATLFSVKDDLMSWQGYSFFLSLPSFSCPVGQQPGGGNQPNPTDPTTPPVGPGDPGTPTDPSQPQPPDPVDPVDPTIPDPTDPVDPEWPPVDPPVIIDPPEPPDPDFKGSWSYDWDHGWANTLPKTL